VKKSSGTNDENDKNKIDHAAFKCKVIARCAGGKEDRKKTRYWKKRVMSVLEKQEIFGDGGEYVVADALVKGNEYSSKMMVVQGTWDRKGMSWEKGKSAQERVTTVGG